MSGRGIDVPGVYGGCAMMLTAEPSHSPGGG